MGVQRAAPLTRGVWIVKQSKRETGRKTRVPARRAYAGVLTDGCRVYDCQRCGKKNINPNRMYCNKCLHSMSNCGSDLGADESGCRHNGHLYSVLA